MSQDRSLEPQEDQVTFIDESADRRGVPIWVWFAITNVVVVAACIAVVVVLVNRPPAEADHHGQLANENGPVANDEMDARQPALPQVETSTPEIAGDAFATRAAPIGPGSSIRGQGRGPSDGSTAPAGEQPAEFSMDRILENIDGSIVLVTTYDERGRELGFGSGFLIDDAGAVATNYHVIDGASTARATFRDGEKVDIIACLAHDEFRDLALLQLGATDRSITPLSLFAGADVPQGQDVVAVGHPQGFRFVTTTGIVSAVHRQGDLPDEFQSSIQAPDDSMWIQTTAAISGGNSGGPLLNATGEVVGINTWVAWGENMGFAAHVKHLIELDHSRTGELVLLGDLAAPRIRYDEIVQDYTNRQHWYEQRLLQANTEAEREEIRETDPSMEFATSLVAMCDDFPESSIRFECVSMAVLILAASDSPEAVNVLTEAGDVLIEDFIDHPGLQDIVLSLAASATPAQFEFLRRIEEASSDRTVQALSCYAQGVCLMNEQDAEPDAGIAEWERLIVDYPDATYGGQRLSLIVEERLFEHKYLAIGCEAPEIVGRDADGVEFKLSDYRGQVVVLDFWADWCPHCVNMYPTEREMVENYANRPFAIIGINGDSAGRMRQLRDRGTVTWRSFDDGSFGPIAQQYHISGIPTIYVLDADGVIRFKDVRGEELVDAVAVLMADMPAAMEPDPIPPPPPLAGEVRREPPMKRM